MTPNVITISPGANLRFAATLLSRKGISGLPVVRDDGALLGVLSEKDILRVLRDKAGLALPGGLFDLLLDLSEARQKDLLVACRGVLDTVGVAVAMTGPAKTVPPDLPALDAIRLMLAARINRLPVVEHDRLVGIVTRHDLLTLCGGLN
jgi:CBS domain-containing protein